MPELMDTFAHLFAVYSQQFATTQHNSNTRDEWLASLPNDIGAYLIYQKSDDACPIYIGSSGKIKRGPIGLIYGGSTIRRRILGASTPYRLNFNTNLFEFDPTTATVPPAGYAASIPLADIEITCIVVSGRNLLAPSVLEHLLIQGFINQFTDLPRVNQKI